MNKRQLENLVAAGAFDTLNPNRKQSHAAIEGILKQSALAAENQNATISQSKAGGAIELPDQPSVITGTTIVIENNGSAAGSIAHGRVARASSLVTSSPRSG